MVLKKFLLEPYLNNRYWAGVAAGKAQVREEDRQAGWEETHAEWQAWYERMMEAREQGEAFDELPPGFDLSPTRE